MKYKTSYNECEISRLVEKLETRRNFFIHKSYRSVVAFWDSSFLVDVANTAE